MKHLAPLAAVFLVATNSLAADAEPHERVAAEMRPEMTDRLRSSVREILDERIVPGLSLAIFDDHRILYATAAGVRDVAAQTPVELTTRFEAASLSKTVFAYLVTRLVAEHLLSLDTPVHSILPLAELAKDERQKKLTPNNILSHGSGLPNWRGMPNLQASSYATLFDPHDKLRFKTAPDTKFDYSGEAYLYLQKVVEKRTGAPLEALTERYVFKPFSMQHSSYVLVPSANETDALGHEDGLKPVAKKERMLALSAASLHTTATDYANFLIGLIQAQDDPQTPSMIQPRRFVERIDGGEVNWGLGVGLLTAGGKRYLFHWGDNDSFKAYYLYSLTDHIGFVYFANGRDGLAIRDRIARAIFAAPIPMWPDDYKQR